MRNKFKMRLVVREFKEPFKYAPQYERRMVEMECGHTKRDPLETYGNETAVKVRDVLRHLTPDEPRRVRCYQCGKDAVEAA